MDNVDLQPAQMGSEIKDLEPGPVTGRVRWYALFSLLLLAATMAEFLTGSTPILMALTHPEGFAILVGLYGGGALLIREVTLRWKKRWGAVLLLGGAWAVADEGFGAKTLLDPTGSVIGNQMYSHWLGINWVPVTELTLFHSVFSLATPLILVELLFPETKGKRLLRNRSVGVTVFLVGLVFSIAVFLQSLGNPYVPSIGAAVLLATVGFVFIIAAMRVPRSFLQARTERPDRREFKFLLLGVGFLGSFFLFFLFGPHFLPWPATAALFIPLAFLIGRYLTRHAGHLDNDRVKIDFVLGMTLIFIPMDTLLELTGNVGVLVFTAFIIGLMIWIRQKKTRPYASSNALAETLRTTLG